MIIAKVVGNVVSTVKHSSYAGRKLMIVRPMHLPGEKSDDDFIALDAAHAGIGDTVLVCSEGQATRALVGNPNAPVRSSIIGIVDSVSIQR